MAHGFRVNVTNVTEKLTLKRVAQFADANEVLSLSTPRTSMCEGTAFTWWSARN
jgi:hypothetical protein